MANAAMLPILLICFLRLVMAHRLLLNEKEAESRVPAKSAKEHLTWMLPVASFCSAMLAALLVRLMRTCLNWWLRKCSDSVETAREVDPEAGLQSLMELQTTTDSLTPLADAPPTEEDPTRILRLCHLHWP